MYFFRLCAKIMLLFAAWGAYNYKKLLPLLFMKRTVEIAVITRSATQWAAKEDENFNFQTILICCAKQLLSEPFLIMISYLPPLRMHASNFSNLKGEIRSNDICSVFFQKQDHLNATGCCWRIWSRWISVAETDKKCIHA